MGESTAHILFIGGVFAKENEAEVIRQAKKSVEFSANELQLRLIAGLRESAPTEVISAPFIGHYPNQSSTPFFRGFSGPQTLCSYVAFNNLWGFRNLSRAHALRRAVRAFAKTPGEKKLIVVFSAHDPFLAAAAYAKRLNPGIRICAVLPDMPQYMNLESRRGHLYDLFKRFDTGSIYRHLRYADASVVLTEPMASALGISDRPYAVAEGIVDSLPEPGREQPAGQPADGIIRVVYTGKLYLRFGIGYLLDAFSAIKGGQYRLILCGDGDAADDIRRAAARDSRIVFTGQVTPEQAMSYAAGASVLVNPRRNSGEYTRYSFPSKIIGYLLSGKPVVAFMLDGMPPCYRDFLFEANPDGDPAEALRAAIEAAVKASPAEAERKRNSFIKYASDRLLSEKVAETILRISFDGKDQPCEN